MCPKKPYQIIDCYNLLHCIIASFPGNREKAILPLLSLAQLSPSLLLSLRLKLYTEITLNHHPPPTTNFFKGSRSSQRLIFNMQA